jgi:glutamyl-tRNA reductase
VQILLVGLNHKNTPLEVRERVSFSKEQLVDALPILRDRIGEGVILSTCNRTEVYTATENPGRTAEQIRLFVADFHRLDPGTISPYLTEQSGHEATRHLFRVAAGLDSMIVGESQILGQVREALTVASESQSVQVPMVGTFHAAVRVGRRVREETDVGRNALSISYAGVHLAQRVLGTLGTKKVLLVGAGEAGRLVAQALRTVGVADLVIANRTRARGDELARSLGGRTIAFSDLELALADVDIVIAATDSPEFVITRDMVASASQAGKDESLFVFDLALPRDVDPEVASLDGVELFNIDDLSTIAEENLEKRKRSVEDAQAIVEEEMARFSKWWDSLDAAPIIKTLRQQTEEIRKRELDRALGKMPNLSAEHAEVVDALTRSIVNRMLHDPIVYLKRQTDKSQLQAVRDLFRLWEEEQGKTAPQV